MESKQESIESTHAVMHMPTSDTVEMRMTNVVRDGDASSMEIVCMGKPMRVYSKGKDVWFCGLQAANLLGYSNCKDALQKSVSKTRKTTLKEVRRLMVGMCFSSQPLGHHEGLAVFITYSGLCELMLGSEMALATKFQDWVLDDVLPAIRLTGGYQLNTQVQLLTSELANQKLLLDRSAQEATEAKLETERIAFEAEQARIAAAEREAALKLELDQKRIIADNGTKAILSKLMYGKTTIFYVATSDALKKEDIYKLGSLDSASMTALKARLVSYNSNATGSHIMYYVNIFTTFKSEDLDHALKKMLAHRKKSDEKRKELVQMPYYKLIPIIRSNIAAWEAMHTLIIDDIAKMNIDYINVPANAEKPIEEKLDTSPAKLTAEELKNMPTEQMAHMVKRFIEDTISQRLDAPWAITTPLADSIVLKWKDIKESLITFINPSSRASMKIKPWKAVAHEVISGIEKLAMK
jgi:prophage antirepressor-like protein